MFSCINIWLMLSWERWLPLQTIWNKIVWWCWCLWLHVYIHSNQHLPDKSLQWPSAWYCMALKNGNVNRAHSGHLSFYSGSITEQENIRKQRFRCLRSLVSVLLSCSMHCSALFCPVLSSPVICVMHQTLFK